MPKIMTANRLLDGAVVYLGHDDVWFAEIASAVVAHTDAEIAELEAAARRGAREQRIVGAYAIDVSLVEGRPQPLSVRELIRASRRPTILSVAERQGVVTLRGAPSARDAEPERKAS